MENVELYYDNNGILFTMAMYEKEVKKRKYILGKEIEALTVKLQQVRRVLDDMRGTIQSAERSKQFHLYTKFHEMRRLHGQTYSNIIHARKLLLKWAYQV